MRRALALSTLVLLASSCLSQTGAGKGGQTVDPYAVPPDAFVTVRRDANGADIVDIKMRKVGYPLDLLRKACEAFGPQTGSEVRGLYVYEAAINGKEGNVASTASFGCNNLVDPGRGEINLDAVVKSFLGAPDPWTVKSFLVVFADETPTNQTIKSVRKGSVRLEAQANPGQPGVEYRILTLTQDPDDVQIPRNVAHKEATPSSTPPASKKLNPLIVPLLSIGALGAAVLVYFGLRKEKSKSTGSNS